VQNTSGVEGHHQAHTDDNVDLEIDKGVLTTGQDGDRDRIEPERLEKGKDEVGDRGKPPLQAILCVYPYFQIKVSTPPPIPNIKSAPNAFSGRTTGGDCPND